MRPIYAGHSQGEAYSRDIRTSLEKLSPSIGNKTPFSKRAIPTLDRILFRITRGHEWTLPNSYWAHTRHTQWSKPGLVWFGTLGSQFSGGGNRSTRRKPPTYGKQNQVVTGHIPDTDSGKQEMVTRHIPDTYRHVRLSSLSDFYTLIFH